MIIYKKNLLLLIIIVLQTSNAFKTALRSFRLSKDESYDYVRYQEGQIKLFLEGFVYKRFLLFAELGYTISKSPLKYRFGTKTEAFDNLLYTALKPYFLFNIGFAYRVRLDLEKKPVE